MEKLIHDNIQSFDTITSASEREVNILIVKVEELLSKIRLLAAHEKRESVAKIQILKSRVSHVLRTARIFEKHVQTTRK